MYSNAYNLKMMRQHILCHLEHHYMLDFLLLILSIHQLH